MKYIDEINAPTKLIVLFVLLALVASVVTIGGIAITDKEMADRINSYFTGETESEIVVEEAIPFESQSVNDDTLPEGEKKTRQAGVDGVKRIIIRVTKDRDGNEINRETIRTETAKEPTKEIIAVGVKKETEKQNSSTDKSSGNASSSGQKKTTSSASSSSTGKSSSSNKPSNGTAKENWQPYNLANMVNQCEKAVIAKFKNGFYKKPLNAYIGDSGNHYSLWGYVKRSNGDGYYSVTCLYTYKFGKGSDIYYDANSLTVPSSLSGHIYSEEEVKNSYSQ